MQPVLHDYRVCQRGSLHQWTGAKAYSKLSRQNFWRVKAVVARLCCWTSDTTEEQNKLCKPTPLSDVREPRKILPKKENLDLNRYFIEGVAPARHVKQTVAAISPNQTDGKSQNCGFDIEANPQPADGIKHRR